MLKPFRFGRSPFRLDGGGGSGDAFLDAVKAQTGLIGVWSCRDGPALGDLANGDLPMTDLSGNGLSPIECVLAVTGEHKMVAGPDLAVGSLSKALAVDTITASVGTPYAAIQSTTGSDAYTYVLIWRLIARPSFNQKDEIIAGDGTAGTPTAGLFGEPIIYYNQRFGVEGDRVRYGLDSMGHEGTTVVDEADALNDWRVITMRLQTGPVVTIEASAFGGAWADIDTGSQAGFGWSVTPRGLRIGAQGNPGGRFEIAAIALYDTDLSDAALTNIVAAT